MKRIITMTPDERRERYRVDNLWNALQVVRKSGVVTAKRNENLDFVKRHLKSERILSHVIPGK